MCIHIGEISFNSTSCSVLLVLVICTVFYVCRLARLMQTQGQEAEGSSNVSEEIKLTCSQFLKYHKEQCVQDIVQTKR